MTGLMTQKYEDDYYLMIDTGMDSQLRISQLDSILSLRHISLGQLTYIGRAVKVGIYLEID